MVLHQGILIKSFMPYKSKILLFDAKEGLIEVIISSSGATLHHIQGVLVSYHLMPWRGYAKLESVDIKTYPLHLRDEELFFLHHVLEMVLFFIPYAECLPEVFDLLLLLYHPSTWTLVDKRFTQQLFLCKFFSLLGVYPEEKSYHQSAQMQRLILLPLDIMVKNAHECTMATLVQEWVLACIHSHPQVKLFKTVRWYSK